MKLLEPARVAAWLACLAHGAALASPYSFTTIAASATDLVGTAVTGINNGGTITGYFVTQSGPAAVYNAFNGSAGGGSLTVIDNPAAVATGASGINDSGAIVGVYVDASFNGHGFVRSPGGVFTTTDPPGAAYAEAVGINNGGTIVGLHPHAATIAGRRPVAQPWLRPHRRGLLDTRRAGRIRLRDPAGGGSFTLVDPPGAFASLMGGINDLGQFVTASAFPDPASPLGYDSSGFLWTGSGYAPIDVPGAFSTEPLGINDRGQITGLYLDDTGIHGFVATPAPEPASLTLLAFGPFSVGIVRVRRTPAPRDPPAHDPLRRPLAGAPGRS